MALDQQQRQTLLRSYHSLKAEVMLLAERPYTPKSEFGEDPVRALANVERMMRDEGIPIPQ